MGALLPTPQPRFGQNQQKDGFVSSIGCYTSRLPWGRDVLQLLIKNVTFRSHEIQAQVTTNDKERGKQIRTLPGLRAFPSHRATKFGITFLVLSDEVTANQGRQNKE